MKNQISKQDSFFVAGHNGMVGQSIIKALKKRGYCNEELGGKLMIEKRKTIKKKNSVRTIFCEICLSNFVIQCDGTDNTFKKQQRRAFYMCCFV